MSLLVVGIHALVVTEFSIVFGRKAAMNESIFRNAD
jgi:hypothetical protein